MQKRLLLTTIVWVALAACGGHSAYGARPVAHGSPIAAASPTAVTTSPSAVTGSPSAVTGSPTAPTASPAVLTSKLTPQNGSQVTGTALVTISATSFTIRVRATGLKPGTAHAAHIHAGTCGGNGPIVYPLENLVANGSGNALASTRIYHPYQVPASGWSVNVHQDATMSGTGATPIACAKLPAR